MRDVPHGVLEDLHPVGALHQAVELGADLVLSHRADLVVVHFDFHPLLLEREAHRVADVLQRVGRRHRKVAALDRRAVRHVSRLVVDPGGPGRLFGLDLHEAAGHVDVPGHAVEDEEFGLGAEVRDIAQAGRLEVGLGAPGDGARIAVIALHVGGLEHVAGDVEHRLVGERVHARGVRIRHQQHVGGLDAFPSRDRRTVERMAMLELVHVEVLRGHRHVLLLAARVGEAEVDELHFFFFGHLQGIGWRHRHGQFSWVGGFGAAGAPWRTAGRNKVSRKRAKALARTVAWRIKRKV